MGQAKQRKQEIAQLKAQGLKFKRSKVVMCGWFYRAKQADGINLVFGVHSEPAPGFTQVIYDAVQKCSEHSVKQLRAGNYTEFFNAKSYDEAIACLKDHTEQGIREYNRMVWGTETQPKFTGEFVDIECDMEDLVKFAICLGDNIQTLTTLGEIPQDDDNGTRFAYTDVTF